MTVSPHIVKLIERNRQVRGGAFLYEDIDWLRERYEAEKLSLRETASRAHCSVRTIVRWLEIHGIPRRAPGIRVNQRRGREHPGWRGGPRTCTSCEAVLRGAAGDLCQRCRPRHGSANPHWRGYADVMVLLRTWMRNNWRPFVLMRQLLCEECGSSEQLHAHHVVPLAEIVRRRKEAWQVDVSSPEARHEFYLRLTRDPEVNDPSNGRVLCQSCHRRKHRR